MSPAFLSVLSHSDPGAGLGASAAQNAGFQDSEPAPVPQRYPSASVSPENTSLYLVLGRRYRGRRYQGFSLPPRLQSVPQFPGGTCSQFYPPAPHKGPGTLRTGPSPHPSDLTSPFSVNSTFLFLFTFPYLGPPRPRRRGTEDWRSPGCQAGQTTSSKTLDPQPLSRQRFRACARGWGCGAAELPYSPGVPPAAHQPWWGAGALQV